MRNLVPITRPMGAADLTQAAEDAGKLALALSDLAHGVAAYEAATGAAIADLVSEPVPPSNVQKMHNALPTWQGKAIPADLRDAVQHLAEIGTSGPKWGFAQDLDMIERAIDGQTEKLIADVMEFSQSHIRQRFNKLVDRTHARGNRFTREQIRDALQWMLGKTHTAF